MALKVTKVSDQLASDVVVTAFLYGPSGSLKTRSACSFPAPLVANFELGALKSVRDFKDVNEIEVPDWDTMVEISVSLTKLRNDYGFRTLVIDSGTVAYDRAVHMVAKSTGKPYPDLHCYGVGADKMRECIRICLDWCVRNKAHFIVTALDQTTKDENTGTVRGAPDIGRKVGEEMAPLFDIYGHMTMSYDVTNKKITRHMWTVQRDVFPAKDRLGVLDHQVDLSAKDTTLYGVLKQRLPTIL